MKKKIIEPPHPHEERLLNIEVKELTFPNGRKIQMRMSEWHWKMLEYLDQSDDWSEGQLKDWIEIEPLRDDRFQSDLAMMVLRDAYELYQRTWVQNAYADAKDKAADNRRKPS